jgi:hypothetical protein
MDRARFEKSAASDPVGIERAPRVERAATFPELRMDYSNIALAELDRCIKCAA